MHGTLFVAVLLCVVSTMIGLSISRDASAFYGDPRWFSGQPVQLNRLLHNVPGDEFIVTVSTAGSNSSDQLRGLQAITAWNNNLRAAPNSLTKYPLHYVQMDDPNANIVFKLQTTIPECPAGSDACNDLLYPISTIRVRKPASSTALATHELGHSLWYTDQYNADFSCSPADTIMNSSATNCHTAITTVDNNDFQTHYEPTYQSADATYGDTAGAHWNAVYQTRT